MLKILLLLDGRDALNKMVSEVLLNFLAEASETAWL